MGHPAKRVFFFLLAFLASAPGAFGWSFGVCGDSRDDKGGIFTRILEYVEESDMEFLLHTGDLENTGGAASWRRFRERTAGFSRPLYLVVGNHELVGGTSEDFAGFFDLPGSSYSFSHRDAFFAIVDNGSGSLSGERLDWLDRTLAEHPKGRDGVRYLVVVMHIPPRTDTIFPHGTGRRYEAQSERLLKILLRQKVDLVLSSHEHMHQVEEWAGIKVIVSGGAGAPMYPFQMFGFYRIDLEDGLVKEKFIRIRPESRDAGGRGHSSP